jgi:hypothetical protein
MRTGGWTRHPHYVLFSGLCLDNTYKSKPKFSRGLLGENATSQEKLQGQRQLTGCLTSKHRISILVKAEGNFVSEKNGK